MKKNILVLLVVIVLSLTLFACSPESKEPTESAAAPEVATQAAATAAPATEAVATEKPAAAAVETEFPVLPDAENVMDVGGTLIYQTATKMADVFAFYKKELSAKGLKENEILTLTGDDVSQLVFTGSDNGKSLIVQMTKLSETSVSVAIRYE